MTPLVYLMTMPSYSPIKKEYKKRKIQRPSCRFHPQKFLDVFLDMFCSATESEFRKVEGVQCPNLYTQFSEKLAKTLAFNH
jgi:hypothetical protein